MRDGIDQVRSDLFTVDQLAARSNFGSSGWQLFCARLRLPLVGQSKIIRRTAVTRSDPHTCCGQNGITRPGSALFFLAGIHRRRLFSIRRCLGLIGIFAHEFGLKHLEIVLSLSSKWSEGGSRSRANAASRRPLSTAIACAGLRAADVRLLFRGFRLFELQRRLSECSKHRCLRVAGGLGVEPTSTESESAVLPLNYPPMRIA